MAPDPGSARILVVDDEEDVLVAARLLLKRHFNSVQTVPRTGLLLADLQLGFGQCTCRALLEQRGILGEHTPARFEQAVDQ